nr:hypothetical protein [Bacteroidota bacterium]
MIERWMISEDGRMYHVFKNGEARVNGFLEDYSNVGYAFIHLYLASGDVKWTDLATRLTNYAISHFFDKS